MGEAKLISLQVDPPTADVQMEFLEDLDIDIAFSNSRLVPVEEIADLVSVVQTIFNMLRPFMT